MKDIVMMPIKAIKPYQNNPRINKDAVAKVAASLEEFGFRQPIVVGKDNVIIVGHTRLLAAKRLKMTEVPVLIADDMTEEQAKAYRLADNKTAEFAMWDYEKLDIELNDIFDIDMDQFGFELDFEDENEVSADEIEEDEFTDDVESRCKLGDIWQLGNHRLICGDSTDVSVIERLMDGVKADMVFTDPPYNLETKGGQNGDIGKSLAKQGKSIEFIADFEPEEFLNVLPSVFNGNMNAYIFCNKDLLPEYLMWARNNNYSFNVLIWKKPTAIPINEAHRPDIEYLLFFRKNAIWNYGVKDVNYSRCLEYSRVTKNKENGGHPTIKPVELIANELKISSNRDSVVVDLFGGSGSTLIACEQLNRKCFMAELDPKYVSVIIQRYINFKGSDADVFLLRDGERIPYSEVV